MTDGTRLACAVTFDFDGMSSWIGTMKSQNPSMISRGEFGAVAVPRILDLLDRYKVRSSFAVPGHTAYAYPRLVKEIHDRGHELVHHGWVHENPADFDEAGERRNLERGLEALQRTAGVRPAGYRSPAWDFSPRTVDLLIEYGFAYDSSCMGQDFYPYYLRTGDAWSADAPYAFGRTTELVELPVSWSLDDFPPFEFVLGVNEGLKAPSAVEEMWRGDYDYAREHHPDGLFSLTLHPQTIGRGGRLMLLERLLRHFDDTGAAFVTLGEYAAHWKEANPLERWKAANADFAGAHAIESV
jgi:peptidoglycan/xylan/chitin deacetylase (PgdA/CDA1 family)